MTKTNVIEYNGTDNWLLYHYPINDISCNSRLSVMKGQIAILFMDGKLLQAFKEGIHVIPGELFRLVKDNVKILPLIARVEIFFVRQNTNLMCPWGLSTGFYIYENSINDLVFISAYGNLSFYITNYTSFFMEMVGQSMPLGSTLYVEDIQEHFISFITMKFKEVTLSKNVPYSRLIGKYSSIANDMEILLNKHFQNHGIEFNSFVIEAINRNNCLT